MEKKKNIFKDLSSISIKGKTDKKGKFDYLSWATAWSMIKTQYPDAQRKVAYGDSFECCSDENIN